MHNNNSCKKKRGKKFGYVQCNIEAPENSNSNFANFPPFLRFTLVDRKDIEKMMRRYAEEEGLMSQPQEMLNSNFTLQKGTLITLLLLFHLTQGLV